MIFTFSIGKTIILRFFTVYATFIDKSSSINL